VTEKDERIGIPVIDAMENRAVTGSKKTENNGEKGTFNSNDPKPVVRVGVGVLVKDPKDTTRVLCGIRKGSHGAGKLALPGGHLEMFETWEDCARREVLEECNLELEPPKFGHVTNDPMPDDAKHYVTIFMLGTCEAADPVQVPQNMEPEKCLGWKPYSWDELEVHQKNGDLFGPLNLLLQQKPRAIIDFLEMDTNSNRILY